MIDCRLRLKTRGETLCFVVEKPTIQVDVFTQTAAKKRKKISQKKTLTVVCQIVLDCMHDMTTCTTEIKECFSRNSLIDFEIELSQDRHNPPENTPLIIKPLCQVHVMNKYDFIL